MRERLTYANVTSTVAVFLALGLGGAYAADKITSKDLAKGAVKSKAIKNRTILGKDVKDGTIAAADLTPVSVTRPQLGNGVENDCIWVDGAAGEPGVVPVSVRRDGYGEVNIAGIVQSADGPGGDGNCDGAGAEAAEDSSIFVIDAADAPDKTQIFLQPGGTTGIFIVGINGAISGASDYPPGSVLGAVNVSATQLSGISFLAANAGGQKAVAGPKPDRISPRLLRKPIP